MSDLSELGLLEKFIQHVHSHSNQEGLSESYITQIYNNMQELLLVQFLNEELQAQPKVDELHKQLIDQGQRFNEQAQRVKDLEHKNGELQKRINDSIFILSAIDNPDEAYKSIDLLLRALRGSANELEQTLKGDKA